MTSEAKLKANRKYNSKCKSISIRFTPDESSDFERFKRFLKENNVNKKEYLKDLIMTDLEKRGY